MSSNSFLDLIKSQRSESKIPKFKGTFLEYLEVLSENKDIVMLAHKRLHNVIKDQGIRVHVVKKRFLKEYAASIVFRHPTPATRMQRRAFCIYTIVTKF